MAAARLWYTLPYLVHQKELADSCQAAQEIETARARDQANSNIQYYLPFPFGAHLKGERKQTEPWTVTTCQCGGAQGRDDDDAYALEGHLKELLASCLMRRADLHLEVRELPWF